MTLHNDITSALDQPRTLLELVDELGNRAGVKRLGSSVRDGDLNRRAKSMQELGYTPQAVLNVLREMPNVTAREGERALQNPMSISGSRWQSRPGTYAVQCLPVTEWVRA